VRNDASNVDVCYLLI